MQNETNIQPSWPNKKQEKKGSHSVLVPKEKQNYNSYNNYSFSFSSLNGPKTLNESHHNEN